MSDGWKQWWDKWGDALIKLGQFLIVTVGFGAAGIIINCQFQQREIELKELDQLGKFIEHAIDENVAVRQRFAEYFSDVSRSDETRKRWTNYAGRIAKEREEYEAAQDLLQKRKEEAAAREAETNRALQAALREGTRVDPRTRPEFEQELETLVLAQSKAEQEAADLRLQLRAVQQQLTYPEREKAVVTRNSGWVFLGSYNDDSRRWVSSYFDISPSTSPDQLTGSTITVATRAINVRNGMPDEFGAMSPAISVLREGVSVDVVEVLPWSTTGFYWARVTWQNSRAQALF